MPSRIYSDDQGRRIEISEPITFLDKLRLVRRTVTDPETGDEYTDALHSRFRFNEYIRTQLTSSPLKPIVFDTAMSLPRSHPYALRAYLTFDRNLSPKNATHYEWSATALLNELGLTLSDRSPSARRRFLDGLIKHLNGKDISRGVLHLERRTTDDGKDAKLVLTRTPRRPRTKQLALALDEVREPHSPRAHYDDHRTTVHPEPVGDCPDCQTVAALIKIGTLKRVTETTTATQEQGTEQGTPTSPSTTSGIAGTDQTSTPAAVDVSPVATNQSDHPASPQQQDPAPAGARPQETAPGSVTST
jgi:hypothetical protein